MPEDGAQARKAPVGPPEEDDLRDLSAELSQLLADLAKTPDADIDVAAGWTPDLKPGDVVGGRFELRRELGRGGFGVVFEALDRELGREVAFKVVLPGRRISARNQQWVQREAEAVACLNHPNIVTLHDFGRAPTGPYLIFELLRGETLGHRLKRGRLPLRDAVALAGHVAGVLDHAHRAGVVHRDLKPGNVFLCQHGAVKVLDFGLAHLFGRGGVLSGGTPAYMAPEQKKAEPGDARTDLFALGVVLHEMITGAVPARPDKEPEGPVEPGPVAQLPKDAAPARLRRLVGRMLDRDPARRPASAREVLDELAAVERRLDGRRSRAHVAWAGVLACALAVVAWLIRDPPLRGPVSVAVGDFENGTGDREMDGLSGLLATSLEQSRRIQVLPRWRLVALLRELGLPDDARIEGDVARRLARAAGARLLLAGTARRVGEAYAFDLSALDPAQGSRVFSLSERALAKASILGALDRLADGVRRKLHDQTEGGRPLDQTVTPSIEAYRAYWAGVDCMDRPSVVGSWVSSDRCRPHFREALARDPGFALAHYQLAFLLHVQRSAPDEAAAHLDAAVRGIDRMPPKEAMLVRAWQAHVAGDAPQALKAYADVLQQHPEDRQALYLAGYVLTEGHRWAEAIPYLERALDVDPDAEWPLDDLVTALAMLGRSSELRALAERLGQMAPSGARRHAVVRARIWLGEPDAAIAAARRELARTAAPAAGLDLASALFVTGELPEAEAVLERVRAAQPLDAATVLNLARVVAAQGRVAEGLERIDAYARSIESNEHGWARYARAWYLAGFVQERELWREVARARAVAPQLASDLAVVLAARGDLEHAAEVARELAPGSAAAEEHAALVAWRGGDREGAAARLGALEGRDPWPRGVPPPAYFLAEVSADMEDWRGTLAAVERYRALWPRGLSGAWALPRATYLAALAHERLGDAERARAEVDRLLGWLRAADPGLPLARDARTLRQRLGP
ncbi:MAG TPA: protein kinase [Anaeromyxobacter sp.]|nr:protein kinase [Anaeromyxobacter sp.]